MPDAFFYNGHEIPPYQPPAYGYTSVMVHNGIAYVSGHVAKTGDGNLYPGKVGKDVTLEQAQAAAKLALLNAVSSLANAIGDLDGVQQFLELTVFVASASGFNQQPKVANAATNLLRDLLANEENTHGQQSGLPSCRETHPWR